MSRSSTATVNPMLTNYAQGLMNDLSEARRIVAAMVPTVPVVAAAGSYKKFDDRNSFAVYNTLRGLGGSARRIEFSATDGTYNAKPNALEATVDDHERELAAGNPIGNQLLDEGRIKALLNSTMLSHVKKAVDFVIANTTAVANRGNWSNNDIDPIDQIDEQIALLATDVGSGSFITLTLGLNAWRVLRSHPKVKARCNGVQVEGISLAQAKGLFMLPLQDLVVGALSYTASKPGQSTVTKANVIGDNAILSYSLPSPTQYDPSAFKCFSTGQNMIEAVRTYRDESARSDVHAVDWSEDIQQTSSLCVKRLAIN